MKTGKLFEFAIIDLPEILNGKFGDKATNAFDDRETLHCQCGHDDSYLYVIAETEEGALNGINDSELGLCACCIANLIAQQEWKITTEGDRF